MKIEQVQTLSSQPKASKASKKEEGDFLNLMLSLMSAENDGLEAVDRKRGEDLDIWQDGEILQGTQNSGEEAEDTEDIDHNLLHSLGGLGNLFQTRTYEGHTSRIQLRDERVSIVNDITRSKTLAVSLEKHSKDQGDMMSIGANQIILEAKANTLNFGEKVFSSLLDENLSPIPEKFLEGIDLIGQKVVEGQDDGQEVLARDDLEEIHMNLEIIKEESKQEDGIENRDRIQSTKNSDKKETKDLAFISREKPQQVEGAKNIRSDSYLDYESDPELKQGKEEIEKIGLSGSLNLGRNKFEDAYSLAASSFDNARVIESKGLEANSKVSLEGLDLGLENIDRISSRIIDSINVTNLNSSDLIEVQLYPKSLGALNIKLRIEEGKISGKLLVESESVKTMLINSLSDLNLKLAKENIAIEKLDIDVNPNLHSSLSKNNHSQDGRHNKREAFLERWGNFYNSTASRDVEITEVGQENQFYRQGANGLDILV